jgi:hypothetical protein
MALNSTFQLNIVASLLQSLDLADAQVNANKTYKSALTSGTAAGQADLVFHDTRTIAPSSNDDLDLAGVLAGLLGGTLTFVRIKGLIVAAAAANTNNVVVGAAASNQWATLLNATGTVQVRPGALFAAYVGEADATGWAVTAGTGDILRIANGGAGTSVNYDLFVIGASA